MKRFFEKRLPAILACAIFALVGTVLWGLLVWREASAAQVGVRITQSIPQHGHNDMYDGGVLKNTGGYNDDTIYYHTLFEGSAGYGLVGSGTTTHTATWFVVSTGTTTGSYQSVLKDPEWSATPTWTKNRRIKAVVKFDNVDINTTAFIWSGILSDATTSISGGSGGLGKPAVGGCTYKTNGIGFKVTNNTLYSCVANASTGGAWCTGVLVSSLSTTTKYIIEAIYNASDTTGNPVSYYVNNVLKRRESYKPDDSTSVACGTTSGYPQNIFNVFIRTDDATSKSVSISEYKFLQERY